MAWKHDKFMSGADISSLLYVKFNTFKMENLKKELNLHLQQFFPPNYRNK